jgi:hypothetical protein
MIHLVGFNAIRPISNILRILEIGRVGEIRFFPEGGNFYYSC